MAVIEVLREIDAPVEHVFDLARDADLHVRSMTRYGETVVGGAPSRLLDADDEITWSARQFGLRLTLTVRMVSVDRPRHFRDSQVRGPFVQFDHDHFFDGRSGKTLMRDALEYRLPFGVVGAAVDAVVVRRRLRRILEERGDAIAEAATAASGR